MRDLNDSERQLLESQPHFIKSQITQCGEFEQPRQMSHSGKFDSSSTVHHPFLAWPWTLGWLFLLTGFAAAVHQQNAFLLGGAILPALLCFICGYLRAILLALRK